MSHTTTRVAITPATAWQPHAYVLGHAVIVLALAEGVSLHMEYDEHAAPYLRKMAGAALTMAEACEIAHGSIEPHPVDAL